jgi:hypothetical protein
VKTKFVSKRKKAHDKKKEEVKPKISGEKNVSQNCLGYFQIRV